MRLILMELVIFRPPLVYAAGAPSNFNHLLKLVSLGISLPFTSINNKNNVARLRWITSSIS